MWQLAPSWYLCELILSGAFQLTSAFINDSCWFIYVSYVFSSLSFNELNTAWVLYWSINMLRYWAIVNMFYISMIWISYMLFMNGLYQDRHTLGCVPISPHLSLCVFSVVSVNLFWRLLWAQLLFIDDFQADMSSTFHVWSLKCDSLTMRSWVSECFQENRPTECDFVLIFRF